MFPEGIITRELKVGPAFDLLSGTPYAIRVLIEPTRSLVWGDPAHPVMAKLQSYLIPANTEGTIVLAVTDQEGYKTTRGQAIVLDTGEHAFSYQISLFYLIDGSVAKKIAKKIVVFPEEDGSPVDVDDFINSTSGPLGQIVSIPDSWSTQITAAQNAAQNAASSAAAAAASVQNLEETYVGYESDQPVQQLFFRVDPDTEDISLVFIVP